VFLDHYVCIMITSQHTPGVVITGYVSLMKIALVLQKYYTTEGMDLILLLPTIESPPFLLLWPIHPRILTIPGVEMHVSLGAHIPISVHPSSFALLSTATRTQPARELSDAQLGTPDRVPRRSCMSSYSLPLPVSIAITRNSFGSVWTSSRYSAQPPAPNPHESSPMLSLVHPIGSCEGPA